MSARHLDYASGSTPHRAPVLHFLLGVCDALLGCAVLISIPLGLIIASVLVLLDFWVAAVLATSCIPGIIVGGLKLSAVIMRARHAIAG